MLVVRVFETFVSHHYIFFLFILFCCPLYNSPTLKIQLQMKRLWSFFLDSNEKVLSVHESANSLKTYMLTAMIVFLKGKKALALTNNLSHQN